MAQIYTLYPLNCYTLGLRLIKSLIKDLQIYFVLVFDIQNICKYVILMNIHIWGVSFIQGSQTPFACQNCSTFSNLNLYEHSEIHIFHTNTTPTDSTGEHVKQLFHCIKLSYFFNKQLTIENEQRILLIFIDIVL